MAEALKRITFDEFSDNLTLIFERVIHEHTAVLVESKSGELVEVKPIARAKPRRRAFTKDDDEAFLSAAGGWSDVDIDAFLEGVYASRRSSRPPVEL